MIARSPACVFVILSCPEADLSDWLLFVLCTASSLVLSSWVSQPMCSPLEQERFYPSSSQLHSSHSYKLIPFSLSSYTIYGHSTRTNQVSPTVLLVGISFIPRNADYDLVKY